MEKLTRKQLLARIAWGLNNEIENGAIDTRPKDILAMHMYGLPGVYRMHTIDLHSTYMDEYHNLKTEDEWLKIDEEWSSWSSEPTAGLVEAIQDTLCKIPPAIGGE